MPALVLFGRRWRTSSDDFFYSGIFNVCLSLTWFLIFFLEWTSFPENCEDVLNVEGILLAFLIALSVSFITDCGITYQSTRGTIMDTRSRRHVNGFIYARVVASIAEAAFTIWALVYFTELSRSCVPSVTYWSIRVAAVVLFIVLLSKTASCFMVYDVLGKHDHLSLPIEEDKLEKVLRLWKWRFKMVTCCCCMQNSEGKIAFEDVSKVLASIFSDVDLVPSDVLAGLLLLYGRIDMSPELQLCCLRVTVPQWMSAQSASHYFKYAVGCYGWPFYVLTHPCSWPCRLAPYSRCSGRHSDTSPISGDFCGCQLGALCLLTGAKSTDLVHVSFVNRLYQVPFFVAIDHETKSVIVSIRGSITLHDVLTDLSAECEPLDIEGIPESCFAHRGMAKAAKNAHERLCDSKALEEAFSFHSDYSLVIVGHSLGAGVAALMGLHLHRRYPSVRCFLYGPPGGLLNSEAVKCTEQFQMSVILGYDLVPRLSMYNVMKLKESIMRALYHCTHAKYRVFAEGCWKVCLTKTKHLEEVGSIHSHILRESTYNTTRQQSHSYPRMYLPGRILHIFRTRNVREEKIVESCWKTASDFEEILVTPNMLTDHMPFSITRAFVELSSRKRT